MTGLDPDELAAIIAREEKAAEAATCDPAWRAHLALARNYRWQLDHAVEGAAREPEAAVP